MVTILIQKPVSSLTKVHGNSLNLVHIGPYCYTQNNDWQGCREYSTFSFRLLFPLLAIVSSHFRFLWSS